VGIPQQPGFRKLLTLDGIKTTCSSGSAPLLQQEELCASGRIFQTHHFKIRLRAGFGMAYGSKSKFTLKQKKTNKQQKKQKTTNKQKNTKTFFKKIFFQKTFSKFLFQKKKKTIHNNNSLSTALIWSECRGKTILSTTR